MVDDIYSYWYPVYDKQLDFWSVDSQVRDNSYQVAACMYQDVAEHVAQTHNKWYQDKVFNGYADNVTLSAVNCVIREIIEDLDDSAEREFWESQIMTDVSQLPDAPHVLPF